MAKRYVGSLEPFDPDTTIWSDWEDCFNCYCELNELVTEAKQRQMLSLSVGIPVYNLLGNLIRPATVRETPVADLLMALRTYYTPKKLVIAERNRFYLRSQKEGETVAQYVAQLRFLSKDCAFRAFLDEAIRDRFVVGLRNEAVKRRLLGEENLELPRAIELASSMEAAEKDSHELSRSQVVTGGTVHQFQRKPAVTANPPSKCYRCGGLHDSNNCRFKEATCNSCKKVGHLAKVCRSSQQSGANPSAQQQQQRKKFVKRSGQHQIEEQFNSDIVHVDVNCAELPRKYLLPISLNGHQLKMEVDTGAAVTLVNEFVWNSIGSPKLRRCPYKLNRYGNVPIKVIGMADVNVSLTPGSSVELPLIVVKGDGNSLLGRTWIVALKLDVNKFVKSADIHTISQVAPADLIEPVLNMFQEVFKPGLGHCANAKAKLLLKPGAQPRFFKARPMPFAMKEKVEADLHRLEQLGVLTPIQTAEWAAPIVAVPKPNGTVRVCGDYKVTVNPWLDVDQYPLPRPEELFAALNGGQKFSKIDLRRVLTSTVGDQHPQRPISVQSTDVWRRVCTCPLPTEDG